jgi:hypothetical protein
MALTIIAPNETGKRILLFVREKKSDEFKNTMAYVFLADSDFLNYTGSKPMNIKWEVREPMPPFRWKDSAKMAIG